ncbi:MAG: hypothetical protein RLZZ15_66 [Verrucomicrobiota bacterium]|jgi:hypothetical protein
MTLRRFLSHLAPRHSCAAATAGLLLSLSCAAAAAALPAFPGAEGPGAFASGGRGGEVFHVTTLNATGPGSLADAVSAPNRIIVFDVSGIIDLTQGKGDKLKGGVLAITQPNLTIAGQTAPGEGICLKGGKLTIDASNIIIRHLRVRRGFIAEGDANDAVEINVKDPSYVKPKFAGTEKETAAKERIAAGEKLQPAHDIILDHVSASWATDENFTISGHIDRVHAQYCFAAEALDYANPKQTPPNHAYGSLFGGAAVDARVGIHHSIFAHHRRRTPQCSAGDGSGTPPVVVDFRNNTVYDSIQAFSHTGGHPIRMNFVGNYYRAGPSTQPQLTGHWFTFVGKSQGAQLHAAGNEIHGFPAIAADNWRGVLYDGKMKFSPELRIEKPFDVSAITTHSAAEAHAANLENAGATLPSRDAVDERIAHQIRTGTGKVIGKETDLPLEQRWPDYRSLPAPKDTDGDGLPDFWETQFGLDPKSPTDSRALTPSGYTNLEHYLNNTDRRSPSVALAKEGANIVFIAATSSRARVSSNTPGAWRLTRTGNLAAALTVSYTISGDATVDRDFAPLTGTATFPAGASSIALSLTALPTAADNRTVVLTLTPGARDHFIGCPAQSLVVIRK